MNDLTLTLHPIAVIHTPYKEKFSVPRQPDLVQDGIGIVELLPPYNSPEAVRGLEQFSHLWLIFQFDKVPHGKWQSTVRPPRLGGNQRVGVFASRATHRPNPLKLNYAKWNAFMGVFFCIWVPWILSMAHLFLILNLILPMLIASLRQNQVLHKKNHLRN